MYISKKCLENVLFVTGSLLTTALVLISSTVQAHYSLNFSLQLMTAHQAVERAESCESSELQSRLRPGDLSCPASSPSWEAGPGSGICSDSEILALDTTPFRDVDMLLTGAGFSTKRKIEPLSLATPTEDSHLNAWNHCETQKQNGPLQTGSTIVVLSQDSGSDILESLAQLLDLSHEPVRCESEISKPHLDPEVRSIASL